MDKILWIDELSERDLNGVDHYGITVTFDDGSILTIQASVKSAPLQEMTPQETLVYDEQGERAMQDGGQLESFQLSHQSTAFGMVDKIKEQIDAIPEHDKIECIKCAGWGACPICDGAGCVDCSNTGRCHTCDGRGAILV